MASRLTYLGTHGRNPAKDVQPISRLGVIARGEAVVIDDRVAASAGFQSGDDLALYLFTLFVPRGDDEPHPRFKLEQLDDDAVAKHRADEEKARKAALAAREAASKDAKKPATAGKEA